VSKRVTCSTAATSHKKEGSDCYLSVCTKLQLRLPGLLGVSPGDSIVLLGDLNVHVSNDGVILRGLTKRNSLPDLNPDSVLFLDFCASHRLCITHTIFEYKVAHKYTIGQRLMINSVVKGEERGKGAEQSTDHHLVVSWILTT